MKVRREAVLVVIAVALLMLGQAVWAQEATRTAMGWSGTQVVSAAAADWAPVLSGYLKTGTPKDISILFTAESMLATYTYVQTTKNGSGVPVADSDSSEACIEVRCLVDGAEAFPGVVTFDSRLMKLSAKLGEAIYTDPATGILMSAGDQWISIYERTKSCHAFNWCWQNLGAGEHLIVIQAKVSLAPSAHEAAPENTDAVLGKRMLNVDEVNLKTRTFPN